MPDNDQQKEHAANLSAERHLMHAWNLTRNQARQRLHDFRAEQAAAQPRQDAQPADAAKPVPPPPTITTTTESFPAKPFTLNPGPPAFQSNPYNRNGFSGSIMVCVDNGDSTFTQKTATFVNGVLASVA